MPVPRRDEIETEPIGLDAEHTGQLKSAGDGDDRPARGREGCGAKLVAGQLDAPPINVIGGLMRRWRGPATTDQGLKIKVRRKAPSSQKRDRDVA